MEYMLPVSLVLSTTYLQIDIKDRHGTNIHSMTINIYVFSSRFPPPFLALWLEIFEHRNTNSFKLSVCLFYLGKRTRISGYNLMRNNPQTRSYSLIRNIYRWLSICSHVNLGQVIPPKKAVDN